MIGLDTLAIARDRGLGLEAHRVLRCLERSLSFDRYEPIDAGGLARMLDMRPQAISRALRILTERGVIARGRSMGRSGTFRFEPGVALRPATGIEAVLRPAVEADVERLSRAGGFTAAYGRDELRKDIAAGRCWVVVADGVIVGQLAIRKDPSIEMSYVLARLQVDRLYRRMGLAKRLLAAMERSLDGNRIHAYCAVSDPEFLKFLIDAGFALSGYVKGRDEGDTRLFFGKIATSLLTPALTEPAPPRVVLAG